MAGLVGHHGAGLGDRVLQQVGVGKSGYIRSTTDEVWLHRTNTLRKAAWQLRRKQIAVVDSLLNDFGLRARLGYEGQCTKEDLKAWVVDTSIEFDQQRVDGFNVVSREALEVILRDEKALLRPLDQVDADDQMSLFPEGFSASRFVDVVESGELWRGVC